MAAALYGASHPYGYTELGTEASNKAMTKDGRSMLRPECKLSKRD